MSEGQTFSAFKWENRVLLVFVPEVDDTSYSKQIAYLQKHEIGLQERKIKVITVFRDSLLGYQPSDQMQVVCTKIWERFMPSQAQLQTILIGLDGSEKWRTYFFNDIELLFDRIDAMPMRRSEIRRSRSGSKVNNKT